MAKQPKVTDAELKEVLNNSDDFAHVLMGLDVRLRKTAEADIADPISAVRALLALSNAAGSLMGALMLHARLAVQRKELADLYAERAAQGKPA